MNKLRKDTMLDVTPSSPSAAKQSLATPVPFMDETEAVVEPISLRKKINLTDVKKEMKLDVMPQTPASPTKSNLLTEYNFEDML